jgi:hypothetical protein
MEAFVMRIISTTDISREGNDCYIYESVTLAEQFDIYSVINFLKVTGWAEQEEARVLCTTGDLELAKKVYKDAGGEYQEYDPEDVYF